MVSGGLAGGEGKREKAVAVAGLDSFKFDNVGDIIKDSQVPLQTPLSRHQRLCLRLHPSAPWVGTSNCDECGNKGPLGNWRGGIWLLLHLLWCGRYPNARLEEGLTSERVLERVWWRVS